MNIPKSGLFACLLLISFVIHAGLFMLATTHYLDKTRLQQGQLILNHLSEDSVRDLANANPVSLALLANRYAHLPNVAALRIYDANDQQLVITGSHKTQLLNVMTKEVRSKDKIIGRVELSLLETSNSEVLSQIWWVIFLSLLVHVGLWGLYILLIRPQQRVKLVEATPEKTAPIDHSIEQIKQTLQQKEQKLTEALQSFEESNDALSDEPPKHIALSIKFFDPKELLRNVSPTLSTHYFETCQVLLERSIELATEHFNVPAESISISQRFNEQGAKIIVQHQTEQAIDCVFLINAVSALLFETLYDTYRQHKRFALPTCSAVATEMPSLELDSLATAERLLSHAQSKEFLVYLNKDLLRHISKYYQLVALANPHNMLMRQSFSVTGMSPEIATIAGDFRKEILQYRA